jgi:hypothetical protein
MKFNLSALKAYVGGLAGAGFGTTFAGWLVHGAEAAFSIDIPANIEVMAITAIAGGLSYVGVYFTSNTLGSAAK